MTKHLNESKIRYIFYRQRKKESKVDWSLLA